MRAVFLDRDDTLIECNGLPAPPPPAAPGDLTDPALVRLLPGVQQACADLKHAGFALIVVSNQGVVARGGATLATVEAINQRVSDLLQHEGRPLIDRFYFCPFHPKGRVPEFTREHPWRKPAPGMLLAAAADLYLDLSESWLIGDAARDVEAGIAAGLDPRRCLRIGPGQPLPDLTAAARVVLGER
jgi:histidinol-phosphate phosphatase family protein